MLRQGPIPAVAHGAFEYVVAILLIVAPFILSFKSSSATAVSIVVGVLVLVVTASTALPTGLIRSIPIPAHLVLDFALAALLVAAPFLFSFSSEAAPTAFFIALGVVHLLVTIGTRFVGPPAASAAGSR